MAEDIADEVETELVRCQALTEPGERECLRCFLLRMINEFGCDGTHRWAIRWRDVGRREPRGLLASSAGRGGCCDCEILMNVVPDYP